MSKNKFTYEVTDIDELHKFAKNAVRVIPAKKVAIRSQITNMLLAGVDVKGIRVTEAKGVKHD